MSRKKKNQVSANLEKTLIQFIQGKRYTPLTQSELIEHLGIPPIHVDTIQKILSQLVEKGSLALKENRYQIPSQETLAVGVISVHPKGFGFVKVAGSPDVFIPKHSMLEAVDGDTVEIEISPEVSPKGPEGAIISIVKRGRSHLAGTIIGKSGRHYHAYAPLLGPDKPLLVKTVKNLPLHVGDRVICEVTDWKKDGDFVEGKASECLGNIADPSIDTAAAAAEFQIRMEFPQEVVQEAKAFGRRVSPQELEKRRDLTQWETVTIDPDTARDYDDAISVETDSQGHFHLGVHIADVAHYVKARSALDQEAFSRCNSTYFPGTCIPMLPEELSNELCSLKPKVIRLTQSVLAEFDPSGELLRYEICRSAIKSQKRFTYKEALQVLLGKKKSRHAPLLERMAQLCALLKKKRSERGSVDFAMADDVILVDEKGVPQKIERVEYDITHQMIEEFALKANELVAISLTKQKKPLIYRIHEEPASDNLQDFYTLVRSLGFTLPPNPKQKDIQKLFVEAKDSPLFEQLSISFIRSMRLASYSSDNIGHYGLSLEHYCHFTSPIRRYTDLIIQRQLFNELPPDTDLQAVAAACSEKERLSFRAESSVVLLKKLRLAQSFYSEDPYQTYQAFITKVKPFALFFQIAQFDLEGSLHISQIGDDYYEYNPKRLQFRGKRTGVVFSVGQPIEVQLEKIDLTQQISQWVIASRKKVKK